jgi:hypothetical protein
LGNVFILKRVKSHLRKFNLSKREIFAGIPSVNLRVLKLLCKSIMKSNPSLLISLLNEENELERK